MANALTYERAHELFSYDELTGEILKKKPSGWYKTGDKPGYISTEGYLVIAADKNKYLAHRLAWLMHYGYFPSKMIDHINRNRTDNRIANLREVTNTENAKNKTVTKNSSSGLLGVSWHKASNKWHARIKVNEKVINLGLFLSKDDAYIAYVKASVKFYPSINGGFTDCELKQLNIT